jgi:hypothetical protein
MLAMTIEEDDVDRHLMPVNAISPDASASIAFGVNEVGWDRIAGGWHGPHGHAIAEKRNAGSLSSREANIELLHVSLSMVKRPHVDAVTAEIIVAEHAT